MKFQTSSIHFVILCTWVNLKYNSVGIYLKAITGPKMPAFAFVCPCCSWASIRLAFGHAITIVHAFRRQELTTICVKVLFTQEGEVQDTWVLQVSQNHVGTASPLYFPLFSTTCNACISLLWGTTVFNLLFSQLSCLLDYSHSMEVSIVHAALPIEYSWDCPYIQLIFHGKLLVETVSYRFQDTVNIQFPPIIYHGISIEYKDNPMNIQWVRQHELCLLPCCVWSFCLHISFLYKSHSLQCCNSSLESHKMARQPFH